MRFSIGNDDFKSLRTEQDSEGNGSLLLQQITINQRHHQCTITDSG